MHLNTVQTNDDGRFPGVYGIGAASLVGCDAASLMNALGSSAAGPVVKGMVAFPLVYHYLGAVRHTVSRPRSRSFQAAQTVVTHLTRSEKLMFTNPLRQCWMIVLIEIWLFNRLAGREARVQSGPQV